MIDIKEIVIRSVGYGSTPFYYNRYVGILKTELDTLLDYFISNTNVLNKGDRLYFLKDVDFPRFKLSEYGKDKDIKRTISPLKSNILIVDKSQLQNLKGNVLKLDRIGDHNLIVEGVAKDYPLYEYRPDSSTRTDEPSFIYIYYTNSSNDMKKVESFTRLSAIKDNIAVSNFMDTRVLTELVNKGHSLTYDMVTMIKSMFNSNDPKSISLAMDTMSNSNYTESEFKLLTLMCTCGGKIASSPTRNSVNWKALDNYMNRKYGGIGSHMNIQSIVETYIRNNKFIYTDDIPVIKGALYDSIKGITSIKGLVSNIEFDFDPKVFDIRERTVI